ncbi:MAG: hypothetical protein O2812_01605 [Chloroflexi bacterium]|nr:hypothetical protein [Chloroflexota bacterium]
MEQGQSLSHLPSERFELALDSERGMLTNSTPGSNAVTITNQRAIRHSSEGGRHTTGVLSLERLSGMEIIDVGRPSRRLGQGLLSMGVGAVLGALAWALFSETLFVLILGGLPALAGVYLLSGYIFPDERGELTLYAGSYTMRLPLLTEDARRDAYLVVDRITELAGMQPPAPGDDTPESAEEPGDSDFAPSVSEVLYSTIFTAPGEDGVAAVDIDIMVPEPTQEASEDSIPVNSQGMQMAEEGPAEDGQDVKPD